MCGIAGILDLSIAKDEKRNLVERMNFSLGHRGPDASGSYSDDLVGIGHVRLSILDLSANGAQPMIDESGQVILSYNGEVYNYLEIKKDLIALGHSFKGTADTEVILRSYLEWGIDGLKKCEGIFALAIWDRRVRKLILMRDRLGVKPLFYTCLNKGGLAFASEIKALKALGVVDPEIDQQAFCEYLWYGNSFKERTLFKNVRSLLPGHILIVDTQSIEVNEWWSIEEFLKKDNRQISFEDSVVEVRNAIDKSVKRQLVSDVPVGLFLSGGLDSSAIAASAMHVQSSPLVSYSVGFEGMSQGGELEKAKKIANHLGLDHHEVHISGSNLEDVIVSLVSSHDEPFGDAANIPLLLLSKQLGGRIKVVLQGDGGDEMFGGYRRYSMLHYLKLWNLFPKIFFPLMGKLKQDSCIRLHRMAKIMTTNDAAIRMASLLTTERLEFSPLSILNHEQRRKLNSETDPFLSFKKCDYRFSGFDEVRKMLLTDIMLQLPSQFLAKVDRSTMACGIEARVPLLDENILKLAINMPTKYFFKGLKGKHVLRESLRGRLPEDIVNAPKLGFGVPYKAWLKGPLYIFARDAILDEKFLIRFGFERYKLEDMLYKHKIGIQDNGFTLWKVLQLALWSENNVLM